MSLLRTVIGHEKPKRILLCSLRHQKVATTYLFAGESGIGKRLSAIEFAKAVNCNSPEENRGYLDSCDKCNSCSKINSLSHPDLKIVEPENGMIKIEAIRKIQEFLSLVPFEGKNTVVIIDNAECLNQAASNAFLKTLEEPPANSLIILITMSPDMLLDTIRSRCFTIKFSLLNRGESISVIKTRTPGIDNDMLEQLVRVSMGRPGIVLKEEGLLFTEHIHAIVKSLYNGEISIQWKDRTEMEDWLNRFLIVLRDLAVLKIVNKKSDFLINPQLMGILTEISKKIETQDIIKLYNEIVQTMKDFRYNLNPAIVANYITSSIKESYGGISW